MRVFEVVEAATSEAPPLRHSVDDIVAAGQRYQRRRRLHWTAAGAGALSVLMIVGVVGFTGVGNRKTARTAAPGTATVTAASAVPGVDASTPAVTDANPPAGAPANPSVAQKQGGQAFTFSFKGYQAGRMTVKDPLVSATAYEIAPIVSPSYRPDGGLYAYLTVYRAGAYDIDKLGGTPKTVAGHRARELDRVDPDNAGRHHRTLAWEYAANAWAVVDTFGDTADDPAAADVQAVATNFRLGAATPARVPLTLDYVPGGYVPLVVGSHAMAGLSGIASFEEGDHAGMIFARSTPKGPLVEPWGETPDSGLDAAFELFVVPAGNSNQQLKSGEKVPTEPRCTGTHVCNVWSADGRTQVQAASDGTVSEAELTKILKGVTLGNVADDRTWTDANTIGN